MVAMRLAFGIEGRGLRRRAIESTDQIPMKTAVRRLRFPCVEDGFKGFGPVPVGLDAFLGQDFLHDAILALPGLSASSYGVWLNVTCE